MYIIPICKTFLAKMIAPYQFSVQCKRFASDLHLAATRDCFLLRGQFKCDWPSVLNHVIINNAGGSINPFTAAFS